MLRRQSRDTNRNNKKVGVVPIRIVKSDVSPFFFFLSDEGPMLETLDYTIRIGSTPTVLFRFQRLCSETTDCTVRPTVRDGPTIENNTLSAAAYGATWLSCRQSVALDSRGHEFDSHRRPLHTRKITLSNIDRLPLK